MHPKQGAELRAAAARRKCACCCMRRLPAERICAAPASGYPFLGAPPRQRCRAAALPQRQPARQQRLRRRAGGGAPAREERPQ